MSHAKCRMRLDLHTERPYGACINIVPAYMLQIALTLTPMLKLSRSDRDMSCRDRKCFAEYRKLKGINLSVLDMYTVYQNI